MKRIQNLITINYIEQIHIILKIQMKQIHSKTRKLYKTYSYNIANLKFMKQVHKYNQIPYTSE